MLELSIAVILSLMNNIFGITNNNGNNKNLIIDNFINILKTQNENNIIEFHEIIMNVNIMKILIITKNMKIFLKKKIFQNFL